MSEEQAKVVDIKPLEAKKRIVRVRFEPILPTAIVDVWRLAWPYLSSSEPVYPNLSEENPELIQSHWFEYLKQPNFMGIMAKVGKRPVGMVLANTAMRPYGLPQKFMYLHGFYVEPKFRGQGIGIAMWQEFVSQSKKQNIFYWEAQCRDALLPEIVRETGVPIKKLLNVIGGKL